MPCPARILGAVVAILHSPKEDDSVQVFGHDEMRCEFDVREVSRDVQLTLVHSLPNHREPDIDAVHAPEKWFLVLGADGYEIRSLRRIVEQMQPYRAPARY